MLLCDLNALFPCLKGDGPWTHAVLMTVRQKDPQCSMFALPAHLPLWLGPFTPPGRLPHCLAKQIENLGNYNNKNAEVALPFLYLCQPTCKQFASVVQKMCKV